MATTYEITGSYVHIAAAGETWDSIAYKAYLQERMASIIIQANPRLCSTVIFEGGERITVPIVNRIETPESLPPWRR